MLRSSNRLKYSTLDEMPTTPPTVDQEPQLYQVLFNLYHNPKLSSSNQFWEVYITIWGKKPPGLSKQYSEFDKQEISRIVFVQNPCAVTYVLYKQMLEKNKTKVFSESKASSVKQLECDAKQLFNQLTAEELKVTDLSTFGRKKQNLFKCSSNLSLSGSLRF